MWKIIIQQQIEELNKVVNKQWELLAHLKHMSRWGGTDVMSQDISSLWENQEKISEILNEAIQWVSV